MHTELNWVHKKNNCVRSFILRPGFYSPAYTAYKVIGSIYIVLLHRYAKEIPPGTGRARSAAADFFLVEKSSESYWTSSLHVWSRRRPAASCRTGTRQGRTRGACLGLGLPCPRGKLMESPPPLRRPRVSWCRIRKSAPGRPKKKANRADRASI